MSGTYRHTDIKKNDSRVPLAGSVCRLTSAKNICVMSLVYFTTAHGAAKEGNSANYKKTAAFRQSSYIRQISLQRDAYAFFFDRCVDIRNP